MITLEGAALRAAAWIAALVPQADPAGEERAPGEVVLEAISLRDARGRSIAAERGRLSVAENRQAEESAVIELAFVRLKSTSPTPGAPIVYLHGGPGGSATPAAADPEALASWARYLELGDVVLLDQRGCGASKPRMTRALREAPPADLFRDRASLSRFLAAASREVLEQFRAEGVDIAGYTTEQSADDLEDLRAALGAGRLRLLAFSYGTHLALATIRHHESSIESAVLIGVEGPPHTRKLPTTYDAQWRKLARMVASDPELAPRIPDLTALLQRVVDRAEREPFVVRLPGPAVGRASTVEVGAHGLKLILIADLGDVSDLPVFPRLLFDLDRGDTAVLTWFVTKRYRMFAQLPTLLFTMDPASGASEGRALDIRQQAQRSLLGDAMDLGFPEVDAVWNMPIAGDDFRWPIVSDVRTLFVSGTLDCNTPPYQAEEVRWGFRRSEHLILEGAGHETWMQLPDVHAAIHRFLGGEAAGAGAVAVPPLRFVPLEGFDPQRAHPSVPRR